VNGNELSIQFETTIEVDANETDAKECVIQQSNYDLNLYQANLMKS